MKHILKEIVSWCVFGPIFCLFGSFIVFVSLVRHDKTWPDKLMNKMDWIVAAHDKWLTEKDGA